MKTMDDKIMRDFATQKLCMVKVVFEKRIPQAVSLPSDAIASGKCIMLKLFPEYDSEINANKNAPAGFIAKHAVNVDGQSFMLMRYYNALNKEVEDAQTAVRRIIVDKIIPNIDALRSDYEVRVRAALKAEGLGGDDKLLRKMMDKFPTARELNFSMRLAVLTYPKISVSGLDKDLAKAVKETHAQGIISTYKSLVGAQFDRLFGIATSVVRGISNGTVASRTKGAIASTVKMISEANEDIGLQDITDAVAAFKFLFDDNLASLGSAHAQMYAACVYTAATALGCEESISLKDCSMNSETLLALGNSVSYESLYAAYE